jgi:hypothetical protein
MRYVVPALLPKSHSAPGEITDSNSFIFVFRTNNSSLDLSSGVILLQALATGDFCRPVCSRESSARIFNGVR